MSDEDARFAARRALGSTAHAGDLHRDARSFMWLDDLRRDLSHAARSLRRNPGFAFVAVLTLALGIGANTAIFSVISAVLLKPLPYPGADRLVQIFGPIPDYLPAGTKYPRQGRAVFPTHFELLRSGTRTLDHISGYIPASATLTGRGDAVRLNGLQMTASMFTLLGVPPALGRTFDVREESPAADAVVVLSHAAWQHYFNGDRSVIGRVIDLDRRGRTIVGVMPERFAFPDRNVQYWIPYAPPPPNSGGFFSLFTIARLRSGVTRRTAEDDVNRTVFEEAPRPVGGFEIGGLQEELVGPVRPALLLLSGAVGLVLLIACVNVANLLMARTSAREREIAVRRAIGASPGRLVRQLLTESGLLALLGGAAGTALAFASIRLLQTLGTRLPRRDLGPGMTVPRLEEIGIDTPVLLFTIAVVVAAGVLCGLLPALRHARPDAGLLRERAASPRLRGTLVVAEIAMAMTLLVGAGLLIHSFVRLAFVERGFDSTNVLTFQAAPDRARAKVFADQLVERLASAPGVTAAGYANNMPLVQLSFGKDLSPAPPVPGERGRPQRVPGPTVSVYSTSPGFTQALGLRLVEGRTFSGGVTGSREALVTRAFAHSGFFDGPAIGRRIYGDGRNWEVVGILEDVKQMALQQRPPSAMFIIDFIPTSQLGGTYFAVRTSSDPGGVAGSIRAIARQLDPSVPIDNVAMLDEIVSNAMAQPRLYAVLLGLFAVVAVTLAAIGIYGVLGFIVTRRTREIGIRVALGARRPQVVGLILRQTAVLTALGVIVGVFAAAGLSRYLEGLLFGVTPLDATTFAGVVAMFIIVAALASYVPARRATRIDPQIALRTE
jgi:putative ABC transport system permease protein